ncbi:TadE family type IV pilus minor pilin [Nocardioides sp. GY 10113]|uniref:TadE family type IV pilus minor pilin n=1 Tax=Nocardioides sp. GY 10113 TaxID=2569761 RepID=UPI001F0DA725|nr:TadE family type IV pilus minor pilin [Nocardioides sp. GY 10113]
MGLPALIAVTLVLVWLLSLGAAQARTVDAAREAARAVARGDDPADAVALAERIAPPGVRVAVANEGGRAVATAAGVLAGPGGLLGGLPGVRLRAEAVALSEGSTP